MDVYYFYFSLRHLFFFVLSFSKLFVLCCFAFVDDTFDENMQSTIGVDFKAKIMTAENGKRIKISIWDTAGQERFRTLTSSYYRGAHGVIFVYDVGRKETFENLNQWLEEVESYSTGDSKNIVKLLVANKVDMDLRQVSKSDGESFAKQHGMLFIEASAKTKAGIQQVFNEVVQRVCFIYLFLISLETFYLTTQN